MSSPGHEKLHGRDCPGRCSVCLAAPVRTVTIIDGVPHVNGVRVEREAPTFVTTRRR